MSKAIKATKLPIRVDWYDGILPCCSERRKKVVAFRFINQYL